MSQLHQLLANALAPPRNERLLSFESSGRFGQRFGIPLEGKMKRSSDPDVSQSDCVCCIKDFICASDSPSSFQRVTEERHQIKSIFLKGKVSFSLSLCCFTRIPRLWQRSETCLGRRSPPGPSFPSQIRMAPRRWRVRCDLPGRGSQHRLAKF